MTEILDTETAKKRIRGTRFFRVRSGLDAISCSDDRSQIDQSLGHDGYEESIQHQIFTGEQSASKNALLWSR